MEREEGKGQAAVKVEQVLHFPAPGMQQHPSRRPSVLVVSAVSLFRDSWVLRCRKGAEVWCWHCRAPWESQRSLCSCCPCQFMHVLGRLVPRKGQSAQVWMHLEALAVLLPGEGGPSSSRSNHRAWRFFTAHFCFSEQQPQKMHTSFFCQHGSDT